jgi:prepilin signal peptidase PulO-like enzyme (type II secretory pathway)
LLLGAAFLIFHLLAVLLYRSADAFGRGDVMIGALVGAMVGLPDAGTSLVLGTLFGGVGSLGVGLVCRSRRAYFAYGPALCLGGLVTLFARPPA